MAWFRVHLTEEQQRIVNEERVAHPDLRVREKMLVLWLLHCGSQREEAAKIVGVSRTTVHRYVAAFPPAAWNASGRATTIVPRVRWPPIAN